MDARGVFMGGRGQKSKIKRGSNKETRKNKPALELFRKYEGTLPFTKELEKHYIKPDLESAYKRANPDLNKSLEYKLNCMNCVFAFEARMRGYNVTAQPNNINYIGDENKIGLYFKNYNPSKDLFYVKSRRFNKIENEIREKTKNWGDYFRGALGYINKKGDGHIVSFVFENNEFKIYDPQTGKKHDSINEFLQGEDAIIKYTTFFNTSRLKFKDNISETLKISE